MFNKLFKKSKNYKNLIFDFDDTLAPCGKFYIEAKDKFCKYQENRIHVRYDICRKVFDSIDLSCIDLPDGFGRLRYPRSFAAASAALDIVTGRPPNETAAQISFDIGNAVFDAPYDVFPNVIPMLKKLKSDGHELFLWTKGDAEIQQSKIDRNNLNELFGEDHIRITMYKTPEGLKSFMDCFHMKSSETIMIGDSIKDDVGCAIKNNVDCVLIKCDVQKWGYENTSHTPTHIIDHVCLLPDIIYESRGKVKI